MKEHRLTAVIRIVLDEMGNDPAVRNVSVSSVEKFVRIPVLSDELNHLRAVFISKLEIPLDGLCWGNGPCTFKLVKLIVVNSGRMVGW